MCSGSEAGSYLRLVDFVYHSILGLRVIKKKKMTWAAEMASKEETTLLIILGFRVQGAGCRVQGSGFRVQGSGLIIEG